MLEYWVPAEDLDTFNANIAGAIREVARYRGPVREDEFAQVEAGLSRRFPDAWREYLQGQSWLYRGWLERGCYLTLLAPGESLEMLGAWESAGGSFPGLLILGTDGGRETLAADARDPLAPVTLIDITGTGWADAAPQIPVEQFIGQVEAGTFDFTWE